MTKAEQYEKLILEKIEEINKLRETIYLDNIDKDRDWTDKVFFNAMWQLSRASNMVSASNFKS